MIKILGIDPGLSGAIAFYLFGPEADTVECYDVPTHSINGKNKLDLIQLSQMIHLHLPVDLAVIEDVAAMPKQGVTSTFSFGYAAGAVGGIVASCGIRHEMVRPHIWKRAMGIGSDKDLSRRKASQRWPSDAGYWTRKRDDGRAEAALLALYGAQYLL